MSQSKHLVDDYVNLCRYNVNPDWRRIECNLNLTRDFIEKYAPPANRRYALSIHYTVDELEAIDSKTLFSEWYTLNAIALRKNTNITTDYIMKHRNYEGFGRYVWLYKFDTFDLLNTVNYPLVSRADFTIEYFDEFRRYWGDKRTRNMLRFDDIPDSMSVRLY